MLTNLCHPNIIKLYSTFQDKKKLYFVLDFCKKGDLATYIRNKIISYKLAVFITSQLVNVLEYLHKNNIGHRDIKAENIVLDRNLKVVLVRIYIILYHFEFLRLIFLQLFVKMIIHV
jgi:serine/threonine protein kinase